MQCVDRFTIYGTRAQADNILLLLLIVGTNFSSFCIRGILVFANQKLLWTFSFANKLLPWQLEIFIGVFSHYMVSSSLVTFQ